MIGLLATASAGALVSTGGLAATGGFAATAGLISITGVVVPGATDVDDGTGSRAFVGAGAADSRAFFASGAGGAAATVVPGVDADGVDADGVETGGVDACGVDDVGDGTGADDCTDGSSAVSSSTAVSCRIAFASIAGTLRLALGRAGGSGVRARAAVSEEAASS